MSEVFKTLNKDGELDHLNVSVHSAFICLLHLANEKGLDFEADGEEQDFTIKIWKINLNLNKFT